ncbi:MAG: uncharacterized protein JWP87_1002 [Labilithrix sp.]|nr:uncharacterized protein [Labilithrix sp.]
MHRTSLAALLALTVLTFAPSAWCDEEDSPPTESRWYGWQVLLVDGAAVVAGAATQELPIFLTMYAVGAPIVHAGHGRGGAALGSLGLRVGLPLVAGGVSYALLAQSCGKDSGDYCGLGAVAVGILAAGAGMVTASLIDVFAISHESVAATPRRPKAFTVTPSAHVDPRGDFSVGAFGTF